MGIGPEGVEDLSSRHICRFILSVCTPTIGYPGYSCPSGLRVFLSVWPKSCLSNPLPIFQRASTPLGWMPHIPLSLFLSLPSLWGIKVLVTITASASVFFSFLSFLFYFPFLFTFLLLLSFYPHLFSIFTCFSSSFIFLLNNFFRKRNFEKSV